ncbi:hypothetical protein HPP92_008589 [Vanilla planifolia]|uniref:Uncharacterized protein n=1 Tax=Vanilla planifolia TaxID=51239 RepID=A0A835RCN7_VANPL|nr:hypothetical protein HPP92_008589 [Vanilla planifolia]
MWAAGDEHDLRCREFTSVKRLKIAAITLNLVAGAVGIAIPFVWSRQHCLIQPAISSRRLFSTARAFAAGVILAAGSVLALPNAGDRLALLSEKRRYVLLEFPVAEFVATMAALGTLLLERLWTSFYDGRRIVEAKRTRTAISGDEVLSGTEEPLVISCEVDGEVPSGTRHVVVAQLLELGIVTHCFVVGLSLGTSQTTSSTKPLIAALSFHQFCQGFALGGCISRARFGVVKELVMACLFAITTPGGIAVGLATESFYKPEISAAVEGILGAAASGILIYVALVNLIAVDFVGLQKRSSLSHRIRNYGALFFGAIGASLMAIWM